MTFDPKKHIIRIQGGREYLPVAARLVWFRNEHPDWGIVTSPIEINLEKQYAIFSCQIFGADGKLMATATKMENIRGFSEYLEKAETGAVGRALAYCGYGTQFAPELEEESRFADAPYPSAATLAGAGGYSGNGNSGGHRGSQFAESGRSGSGGGVQRVREPERDMTDPGGNEEDEEDPFLEPEAVGGDSRATRTAPTITPPPPAEKTNALAGNRCTVEGCPNVLTAGQMTMSINKFGRPLCLLHQKDAQPVATGNPPGARRGAEDNARPTAAAEARGGGSAAKRAGAAPGPALD
jgi:hypothetical protein